VKNFDDLLAGSDAAQNFLAQRLLLDPRDEILRHVEMHIGLLQRHAHLAHRIGNVLFADAAMATEVFEDVLEFVGKSGKHKKIGRTGWPGHSKFRPRF